MAEAGDRQAVLLSQRRGELEKGFQPPARHDNVLTKARVTQANNRRRHRPSNLPQRFGFLIAARALHIRRAGQAQHLRNHFDVVFYRIRITIHRDEQQRLRLK